MVLGRSKASIAGIPVASLAVIFMVILTVRRNAVYGSAQGMWASVLAKQPDNPSLYNYGLSDGGGRLGFGAGVQIGRSRRPRKRRTLKRVAEVVLAENGTVYSSDQLLGHMLVEFGRSGGGGGAVTIRSWRKSQRMTRRLMRKIRSECLIGSAHDAATSGRAAGFCGGEGRFEAALGRAGLSADAFSLGLSLQQLGDVAGRGRNFRGCCNWMMSRMRLTNAQRELAKMGTGGE